MLQASISILAKQKKKKKKKTEVTRIHTIRCAIYPLLTWPFIPLLTCLNERTRWLSRTRLSRLINLLPADSPPIVQCKKPKLVIPGFLAWDKLCWPSEFVFLGFIYLSWCWCRVTPLNVSPYFIMMRIIFSGPFGSTNLFYVVMNIEFR